MTENWGQGRALKRDDGQLDTPTTMISGEGEGGGGVVEARPWRYCLI
jgi:hypothetical protein